jgi:mRNA interferase MazF
MSSQPILRGDVYLVNLDPALGREINKTRPNLVIQNDVGNKFSSTTIVAAISSIKETSKLMPIMIRLNKGEGGLDADSFVDLGQIRTVDIQARFVKKLGSITPQKMEEVDKAIKISLGLK